MGIWDRGTNWIDFSFLDGTHEGLVCCDVVILKCGILRDAYGMMLCFFMSSGGLFYIANMSNDI